MAEHVELEKNSAFQISDQDESKATRSHSVRITADEKKRLQAVLPGRKNGEKLRLLLQLARALRSTELDKEALNEAREKSGFSELISFWMTDIEFRQLCDLPGDGPSENIRFLLHLKLPV